MLYESINDMKLAAFIEVATGNESAVVIDGTHSPDEISAACDYLIMEYMDACGGMSVGAQLDKRRTAILLSVRSRMITNCKILVKAGFYEDVCDILSVMGYNLRPDDTEKIEMRVDQIMNKCKYDYDLLTKDASKEVKSMTREDFTKERVAIMSHYRMYIDPNVYTAMEYACLVNQFNHEIDDMRRRMAKK